MRTLTIPAVVLSMVLVVPAAMAQPESDGGDDAELGDVEGSPGGADENPDAPRLIDDDLKSKEQKKAEESTERGPYPLEVKDRPLTLDAGMSEISLDYRVNADPLATSGLLQTSYGVTDEIQIGLQYGVGSVSDNDAVDTYEVGKAVGVDARYLILDWLSAQLTVPILLDPFALGITLGAPMKFQFDEFALFFGKDLINIRLSKFVPEVSDALFNVGQAALDDNNTLDDDGNLRFLGGIIYSIKPNLAFTGEFGFIAPDFGSTDPIVPLRVSITHSKSNKLDFGGRLGFADLAEARDTIGVNLFVALRI